MRTPLRELDDMLCRRRVVDHLNVPDTYIKIAHKTEKFSAYQTVHYTTSFLQFIYNARATAGKKHIMLSSQ